MIPFKPHTAVALRALETQFLALRQQQDEVNNAFQALLVEQLPAGADLNAYELKRGTHGEILGLDALPVTPQEPDA